MDAEAKLKQLFGKERIKLAESGDHAILSVLKHLKKSGKEKLLIQDQGGWLTYRDYAKKTGFQILELKTDYGIIDLNDLREKADEKSALMINSLAGYFAEQPMEEICNICTDKNCIVVNDASGSVGTELSCYGDIIICSFGKDKPINLHYGGCIAFSGGQFEASFDRAKTKELNDELDKLFVRLLEWDRINKKIKEELKDFEIIHRNKRGINVVVKFRNEKEKEKITGYCKENNYEYTLCPRYMRVNTDAVSIEVKKVGASVKM